MIYNIRGMNVLI